jgi:SAM-dependent methyltransferase
MIDLGCRYPLSASGSGKVVVMNFMEDASYWDGAAGKTFSHPLGVPFLEALKPQCRILDFGCGYGRCVAELRSLGFQNVTGFDFSREMITRGKSEVPELDLRHIHALPIHEADDAFDVTMLVAVLTCIVADDDQASVLKEMRRLLRPGGIIFISDMLLQHDARNQKRYAARKDFGPFGVFETGGGALVRHHTDADVSRWLSGFELLDRRSVELHTMNGNPALGVQLVAKKN